ncbi:hypothetical protein ACVRY7_01380 [Streptococcus ictaluri]|uniref:Uncharacterized protein n=1 Tax=Streptococcus ictaluri 707-05 TaxID=764299 RepID=G5K4N2_9STRE|nr:hypothetical protein [Streptococcus ictaluri]EHI69285.1 hypothetical protein STRIC_1769 [Streptococcus ictaluri 707-05]
MKQTILNKRLTVKEITLSVILMVLSYSFLIGTDSLFKSIGSSFPEHKEVVTKLIATIRYLILDVLAALSLYVLYPKRVSLLFGKLKKGAWKRIVWWTFFGFILTLLLFLIGEVLDMSLTASTAAGNYFTFDWHNILFRLLAGWMPLLGEEL